MQGIEEIIFSEIKKTIEQQNNEIKLWRELAIELMRLINLKQSNYATIDSKIEFNYENDAGWERFSDGYYFKGKYGDFIHYDADKNPYRNISK